MDQPQQESSLHFLDYWRVIRARKEIILAVTLLIGITGAAYTFTLPKIYMAECRLQIQQDALDVEVFQRQMMPTYNPFFMRTQFEIIKSKAILYQVIRDLNLQEEWGREMTSDGSRLSLEHTHRILAGSLSVEQHRDTSLIAIRVYRTDPAEAARIAQHVAEVYREYRLSVQRRTTRRGLDAMENELQKRKALLEEAESELERVRQDLGVTMIGGARGSTAIQADKIRLQALEGDRVQARVDMLVRKARYDQLERLDGEELLTASTYIVNDPALANLRRQLIDADLNLSLLLENYGQNHPEVRRMEAGRNELRKQIDDALSGLKEGLRADYEVALAKFNAVEEELEMARMADIESERERFLPFEKAEREVRTQRALYDAVRGRMTQEGIELEIPRTPVEIVDHAEAQSRPVKPNYMLNIILSVLVGLGAGVGLAYFIEYLDTSVKTVDDVEQHLGLPVLGVIPQKVKPLIEEGPDSPHAEAYRVLRTNLQFTNKGLLGGAFTFISGGVGEGKSTTLFNLAFVCAQMGDKVLVVDSDLRRPVQHTFLGMSNNFGLTNVLLRDVPIEETIKATTVPNLHFLPSGKLPRSSVGLLESQRMRELIKNLKARYDYVFFDSPPIVGVSDASILASEVDGVLLVVQYRKYPRAMSSRARRILENVGANTIGVVLNNINIMRDDYYYYYHSYYSHYSQIEDSKPKPDALVAQGKRSDSF